MKNQKLVLKTLAAVMGVMFLATGFATKTASTAPAKRVKDKSGMYNTGLPIVDPGKFSFTLFVDGTSTTKDFLMMPVFEKQTGIKVKLQNYPYEVAKEKLSLALGSGDYADCIGGWTLSDTDILKYGMGQKTYIPLEGYFKKYCPTIEKLLALPGVRDTMTAPDGHIYSIPYVLDAPDVDFQPLINTKWLKKLGLKMPTTTTEFRNVLVAFKDAGLIPFSADPNNKKLGYLAGWFGMSVDNLGFTMVGNKLTFGANTNQYKNAMKYLADLYKDGLIDPELFTQDLSQWKAKGSQDKYGVVIAYGSGDFMPYANGTKPDWAPLPVLKSNDGSKPNWLRNCYGSTVLKNQVVITDKAKNPAAICRWFDNLFQADNSVQTCAGPLGKTVFKEKTGYRLVDTSKFSKADQAIYNWSNYYPQSLPHYIPLGNKWIGDKAYDEKTPVKKLYEKYFTKVIPQYWVSKEDASSMGDLQTAIGDYLKQKTAEWISGQTDIDSDWNSYVDQLNKLGLKDYVNMRLKAIKQK